MSGLCFQNLLILLRLFKIFIRSKTDLQFKFCCSLQLYGIVQKNLKKIAIVDNGEEPIQKIIAMLHNTEGYEVIHISEQSIVEALENESIVAILYDLKNGKKLNRIPQNGHGKQAPNTLTTREKEIMALLDKGFLYKEIAETIEVTLGTLKQYVHIIYEKLGVSNKTEAINKYFNR
jgi:ATP/maltotriose-dependent transcriptional regulator MalT